ncbi:MAG: hypothetical protein AAGA78_05500, partial [Pseudomonadota bacterium]
LEAEGVDSLRAELMYAVVRKFGPQWDEPGGEVTQPVFVWGVFNFMTNLFGSGQRILPVDRGEETELVLAPRTTLRARAAHPDAILQPPPGAPYVVDAQDPLLGLGRGPREEIDQQLAIIRGLSPEDIQGLSEGKSRLVPRITVPGPILVE